MAADWQLLLEFRHVVEFGDFEEISTRFQLHWVDLSFSSKLHLIKRAAGNLGKWDDILKCILELNDEDGEDDRDWLLRHLLEESLNRSNIALLKLLLQEKNRIKISLIQSAGEVAAYKGEVEKVKLLLEDGRFDPTCQHSHVLIRAAEKGQFEIMRLLLQDGRADPCAWRFVAFHNACYKIAVRDRPFTRRSPRPMRREMQDLLLQSRRVRDTINRDEMPKNYPRTGFVQELLGHYIREEGLVEEIMTFLFYK